MADDDLEQRIATDLASLMVGARFAAAESCTAGRVARTVANAEGAADFFAGSLVAYQERVKRTVLGVTAAEVVSAEAAVEMARSAASLFDAQVTVATTGLAGAEPVDGIEGGTVFVATNVRGDVRVICHHFGGEPAEISEQAALKALDDLCEHLRHA